MTHLRLCLAVLCLSVSPWRAAAAAPTQPNIVFILAEDLGYGDVQTFNPQQGKIKTPNCDRLAAQGMAFTDCHGGSSVCTPTRYGLLTGRCAWRTRLQRGVLDGYPEPLIATDRLTLPKLLRQQGYHTAAMGKWHLGFTVQEGAGTAGKPKTTTASVGMTTTNGPTTRGFDEFFGFQHSRSMEGFFVNSRVTESVKPVDMLPKLTRLAAEHILQRAKMRQPFFLYLALNSPHTPIVPSLEWQGKSGLGDYGDYVMETDWAVGEVLATLDKAGVTSNTLVVFASDNGCSPAAGTPRLESQGHFPSAQFRGYKSDIWDGGHRIPFIARWPGKISAGSRCAAMICLTDFMATTAEILGIKLQETAAEDSFSFLPDLLGTGHSARTSIVHHSIQGQFAIREGSWKLELCAGSGGWSAPKDAAAAEQGLPPVQLYDLSNDIGETNNLQSAHLEIVKRLTKQLESIIANGRSSPGASSQNDVKIDFRKIGTARQESGNSD